MRELVRLAMCVPALLSFLSGCSTVEPPGASEEREALERIRKIFASPFENRELPELEEDPQLEAVLERAFLANPEIESSYFAWAAALTRIAQVTALPDPRFSYEFIFARERIRSWDRTTLGIEQMLPLPQRRSREGEMALAEAVAARRRLESAKFRIQSDVVESWQELWMTDESIDIEARNVALLQEFALVTRGRVAVGRAPQADASRIDLELASAQNMLRSRRTQRAAVLGRINALLSRPVETPLRASEPAYRDRELPPDDVVLALAAERNPEIAEMASEVQGREDALELARLAYFPDIELGIDLTGSMERMLESMIQLPLRVERIRAGIEEAQSRLRVAQAEARARRNDVGAQVVLQLFLARDGERQLEVYEEQLLPRARDIVSTIESSYATGGSSFLDLIDAQRSLLAFEMAAVELQAQRGMAIAELEALCAVDFGAEMSRSETDQ